MTDFKPPLSGAAQDEAKELRPKFNADGLIPAIAQDEATGEILLDELTQSRTRTAGHGEGLLDAFDMGAI